MQANYTARDGQSIYDIALMLYGDISKSIQLLVDNKELDNLNNSALQKMKITYDDSKIVNTPLIKYLLKRKIKFNTITPIFIAGNYYTSDNSRVTEAGDSVLTEDGQIRITE